MFEPSTKWTQTERRQLASEIRARLLAGIRETKRQGVASVRSECVEDYENRINLVLTASQAMLEKRRSYVMLGVFTICAQTLGD